LFSSPQDFAFLANISSRVVDLLRRPIVPPSVYRVHFSKFFLPETLFVAWVFFFFLTFFSLGPFAFDPPSPSLDCGGCFSSLFPPLTHFFLFFDYLLCIERLRQCTYSGLMEDLLLLSLFPLPTPPSCLSLPFKLPPELPSSTLSFIQTKYFCIPIGSFFLGWVCPFCLPSLFFGLLPNHS